MTVIIVGFTYLSIMESLKVELNISSTVDKIHAQKLNKLCKDSMCVTADNQCMQVPLYHTFTETSHNIYHAAVLYFLHCITRFQFGIIISLLVRMFHCEATCPQCIKIKYWYNICIHTYLPRMVIGSSNHIWSRFQCSNIGNTQQDTVHFISLMQFIIIKCDTS